MVMLVLGPNVEEKEPSNSPKGKGRSISTFARRNKSTHRHLLGSYKRGTQTVLLALTTKVV